MDRAISRILSYQSGWWSIWNHKIKCLTYVWIHIVFLSSSFSRHLFHEILRYFESQALSHTKSRKYSSSKDWHWQAEKPRVNSKVKRTLGKKLNSLKSRENEKVEVHFTLDAYLYCNKCNKFSWDLSQVWCFSSVNKVKRKEKERKTLMWEIVESKINTRTAHVHPLLSPHCLIVTVGCLQKNIHPLLE